MDEAEARALSVGGDEPSDGATRPSAAGPEAGGVDVTLVRWMLSLSPSERLSVLQGHVDAVLELRSSL